MDLNELSNQLIQKADRIKYYQQLIPPQEQAPLLENLSVSLDQINENIHNDCRSNDELEEAEQTSDEAIMKTEKLDLLIIHVKEKLEQLSGQLHSANVLFTRKLLATRLDTLIEHINKEANL